MAAFTIVHGMASLLPRVYDLMMIVDSGLLFGATVESRVSYELYATMLLRRFYTFWCHFPVDAWMQK